jgi:hypothetical protein
LKIILPVTYNNYSFLSKLILIELFVFKLTTHSILPQFLTRIGSRTVKSVGSPLGIIQISAKGMESIRSFLPKEQHYVSPFVTLNTEEFKTFLMGYCLIVCIIILLGVSFSMYCSYPTIRRDFKRVICGPSIANTPSSFRHGQRFPHSILHELNTLSNSAAIEK